MFWKKSIQDEYMTPPQALDLIIPHLDLSKVYYEPFPGDCSSSKYLISKGVNVVYEEEVDFFEAYRLKKIPDFDAILTNPPYSRKHQFIQVLKEINKPFFVLLPTQNIQFFNEFQGVRLIVPRKRINYFRDGIQTKNTSFHSSWIVRY